MTREKPNEFNRPTARRCPEKSRVVNILNIVKTLGESVISLATGLLAAALILYSAYVLYDSFYTQNTATTSAWDLLQYKPEIITDGAAPLAGGDTLAAVTEDYRAWLTVFDTNIDYAVMQGEDDLYYASHDVYGQNSLSGAIYLAAGNSGGFADSYNLLFGHHMDNGAMFGALDSFASESYFDSHREGVIVAGSGVYDLKTFAVLYTDAYDANVYNVAGKSVETILSYLDGAGPVIYRRDDAAGAGKIVALSTCASASTDGRLVVFATMTPRDMTEAQSGLLTLRAERYEGVYDAQEHGVTVVTNVKGAVIEYSTDDGKTWSQTAPRARYVNESTAVLVRASYPGLESVSVYTEIRIIPRLAVVTANDGRKTVGTNDPAFSATVTGLVGGDVLEYTVTRPRAGQDENAGVYQGAIIAAGAESQFGGSYIVTYVPGNFTIAAAPPPPAPPAPPARPQNPVVNPPAASPVRETPTPTPITEPITDPNPPAASFTELFTPSGNSFGGRCWALVNLICLLITAYVLFPLLHLRDKFGRDRILKDLEALDAPVEEEKAEETLEDKRKRFRRRMRIGVAAEIIVTIAALVAFILTEDMRLPMVLIDRWTPLMAVLMLLCLALDICFVRLRDKELFEDEPEKESEAPPAQ